MHSAGTVSSHTKNTSSILNTMNIPQYISYTFPVFRKMREKQLCFNKFNHIKHIFPTVLAIVSSKNSLTVSEI